MIKIMFVKKCKGHSSVFRATTVWFIEIRGTIKASLTGPVVIAQLFNHIPILVSFVIILQ